MFFSKIKYNNYDSCINILYFSPLIIGSRFLVGLETAVYQCSRSGSHISSKYVLCNEGNPVTVA
jgi:hypothetical protein